MDVESNTPDAEEVAMRELGQETDRNENRPVEAEAAPPQQVPQERPVDPDVAPQPDAPPPEQPELPEVPEPGRDAPQQRPRDPVTGKFQQRDGKPDTEYSRAVKEKERQDRSWTALQAEKERIRAEKAQWDEQIRMQQLEMARKQYQPLKKDGLTAQQYYEGAKVFEREGDYENAYKAHQVAQEMFQTEQGRAQQMQGVEREYQWRNQMNELTRQYPQIWEAPIAENLERIIAQNPGLYNLPNGFRLAAEGAHLLVENQKLKEAEDEIVSLKAQLEKHQRKSQPSKGGYASPRYGEKDFDDLSLDEMEAHLKHLTSDADNYR